MSAQITQNQLDLCRLAMGIARIHLKGVGAVCAGLELPTIVDTCKALEYQFDELSKQIFNGEIVGTKET